MRDGWEVVVVQVVPRCERQAASWPLDLALFGWFAWAVCPVCLKLVWMGLPWPVVGQLVNWALGRPVEPLQY